jgi:hypothetical protein
MDTEDKRCLVVGDVGELGAVVLGERGYPCEDQHCRYDGRVHPDQDPQSVAELAVKPGLARHQGDECSRRGIAPDRLQCGVHGSAPIANGYRIGDRTAESTRSKSWMPSCPRPPAVCGSVPTLALKEDTTGLQAKAALNPRDPDVQAVKAKVETNPMEMSFAFRCIEEEWDDDYEKRTVKSASIHRGDVSIVAQGANPQTSFTPDQRSSGRAGIEERKQYRELLRGRVTGPAMWMRAPGDCPACSGTGEVRCPECAGTGEESGVAPDASPDASRRLTRARQQLDLARLRAGLPLRRNDRTILPNYVAQARRE